MVSVDLYVNETTRHADVILPPTSALERDQYDLVFHGFAVRNTARFTPAVFEPDDDQRHDWQIFGELTARIAERLGAPLSEEAAAGAAAASPADLVALLLDTGGRTTMAELREHPEGVDLGPLRADDARAAADPRAAHRPGADAGRPTTWPRLRAALDGRRAGDGELLLIGRRHQRDSNSWMHNTTRLTKGRPRHHLLDAPRRPRRARDRRRRPGRRQPPASVASRSRSAAADDMMPGVVSLPHGYGHQVAGTRLAHASTVPGVSINDLTDPALLDVSGNAALSGVPVTCRGLRHLAEPLTSPAAGDASPRVGSGPGVGRLGHQARSPSRTRTAGSMTSRTRVASSRIAADSPTPIIFISSIDSVAKIAKTDTITAAALVTTPAVSAMPRSTACRVGSPARTCSRIRLTTKTW